MEAKDAGDGRERAGERRLATERTLRIVAGLGDPQGERALLSALAAMGDLVVVERCLAADQLAAAALRQTADVLLVASGLHRLRPAVLEDCARAGFAAIVLVPDEDVLRWQGGAARVLPLSANAEVVATALREAAQTPRTGRASGRASGRMPSPDHLGAPTPDLGLTASTAAPTPVDVRGPSAADSLPIEDRTGRADAGQRDDTVQVLVVASGHGAPGRTTVAVSLAAALGAVAPTVLVDADMAGPSVAAYTDADPTRNLVMLAHAEPRTPVDWSRALEQELQPLAERSVHGVVLCGVPKIELRPVIGQPFFARVLVELRQRFRYVVVDVGAELLSAEAGVHRAAISAADQVLLVAASDAIGLWHARQAVRQLRELTRAPVMLILNRFDRRLHHGRREVGWALDLPVAAVVPHDYRGAQRAIERQRPLALDAHSRAGRALVELAGRICTGHIVLPPEPGPGRRGRWTGPLATFGPALTARLRWAGRVGAAPPPPGDTPSAPPTAPVTVSAAGASVPGAQHTAEEEKVA